MRYGGSKLKNGKKCDFCGIFHHLNVVKSKYKGLPIEKTIPYSTNRQCQYFTPDIFGEKRTENVLSVIYAF